MEDIWSVCNMAWKPQCKLVITAALINIINSIWYARNQGRFSNKSVPCRSSLSNIIASTFLIGNLSKVVASASIFNFVVLKKFGVNLHPPKCNTDGSSTSVTSAYEGIFRDHDSNFLLCFVENTG